VVGAREHPPSDQERECMANLNFLFAAYTAVWVLLFFYILALSRRNRFLQKEIEELRELLQRRNQS
jgi:CcmD family protein